MKAWLLSTVVIALVFSAWAVPAQSQCLDEFFHSVKRDFRRNNCWPEPFVRPDRVATRVPFAMMVNAGWQNQNLLGAYHFDENGVDLNEAGELKVRAILAETPPHHRNIYVERAPTQDRTVARVAAVQKRAAELSLYGETPAVFVSNVLAPGWPADEVDAIGRKFYASAPEPRLPDFERSSDN
ncbi:MAG: hypothetical protein GXY83_43825 [Rhodopirellula sp.]|nr:hypothetical protein [Rhodopirellula sp.]